MKINSLAHLRKVLQPGVKLKLIDTNIKAHRFLNKVRTIDIAQTNAIMFEGGSWLDTNSPRAKAKDFTFYKGGFIIDTSWRDEYPVMLNYQFVK